MSDKLFQACVSLMTLLSLFAGSGLSVTAQEQNSDPKVVETSERQSDLSGAASVAADAQPSDAQTDSADENITRMSRRPASQMNPCGSASSIRDK